MRASKSRPYREQNRVARTGIILEFYKSSQLWVVDFTYDGHPRRWLKVLRAGTDARARMEAIVSELYGRRGRIADVRLATADEETQYIRGELPKNLYCPTGRRPAAGEKAND
jgi:hypothetical protein